MKDIKFADIGEGIHEGILRQWTVQPGEAVKEGQTLFFIETDKVTAEIPSPVEGKVHELLAKIGDTVKVGETVLRIDDGTDNAVSPLQEEMHSEPVVEQGSTSVVGQLVISSNVIPSSSEGFAAVAAIGQPSSNKVLATPVARSMARDLKVDISTIKGTGPAGRIMKEDIQKAAGQMAGKEPTTIATTPDILIKALAPNTMLEQIPMSMLRKTIARNMVLSKTTIPHAASMDELDVTDLVALRKQMKAMAQDEGVHLTFMGFVLKAAALALKTHPMLNSSLSADGEHILLHPYVNLGIAVDTPEGLMVPVIKNADTKGILELAEETALLAERCRAHTVKLEELQGGTFSITNYGSTGTLFGLPVIKTPEAGILGVGTITKKPVVINDEIVIRDILTLTLCFDHRIADGGEAGRFMNELKRLLTQPMLLLLK